MQHKTKKMANANDDIRKKEAKERIIECASKLFLKSGIKEIKMDDIARELGISKRTLYENYPNKEKLLLECIDAIYTYIKNKARPFLKEKSHNGLEYVLYLYNIYFTLLSKINKKFFTDLEKYPELLQKNKEQEQHSHRRFMAWMQRCVNEGLFREDTNFEIVSYILQRDIKMLTTTENFPQYSAHELGRQFILFYLRGICTDKGEAIIEDYIQNKNKYFDNDKQQ